MRDEPLWPLIEEAAEELERAALEYTDHRGNAELRSLIAADAPGTTPDDILITSGAANALFVVATSLLDVIPTEVVDAPPWE
jgi:aspartate/methionine/tyrosine aminotransferase